MSDAFGSYNVSVKIIEAVLDELRAAERQDPDASKGISIAVTALLTAIHRIRLQEDAERKDFEAWWRAERGITCDEG